MNQVASKKSGFLTSPFERLSYASYPIGTNILSMLGLTYLTMFYTDEAGLSTGAVATLFLIARIWDAVNDPVFGSLVDHVNPKKGKFKPWVSAGIIALPVATILVFWNFNGSGIEKLIYAYITYILLGMLQTISGVPHSAMATSMTDKLNERNTLISLCMFTGIIGAMLTGILGGPMIKNFGFSNTVLMLSALAFITMVPIHFLGKERVVHPKRAAVSLKNMLDAVVKNKYLLALNFSFLFLMGTSFAMSIGTYFVKWNLGNLELLGIVMICNFIPIALIPLFLPFLISRLGKRKICIFGLSLGLLLSVVQYFVGYDILPLFLLINGIKIIGIYLPIMMMNMFIADCAEYGAYVTGTRNEGINFSIGAFTGKLGGALAGSLSVLLLGVFGYDGMAKIQTETALEGIWLLLSLLPAVGLAMALLIFALFYKLEEKDIERMIAEMKNHEVINEL